MTTNNSKIETRTVTALVNDKPGVLNRITSMLRRRGYTIQSLAVGHSEVDNLSRLTVIVEGGDDIVEKVTKQLHKLIDVIKVNDISDDNIVSRELALMKVKSTPETRSEIVQLVSIYRAKIIANVCSAAETVLPSGTFITIIPFWVADSISILSIPTPARPIICNFLASSIFSFLILVPLLTIQASISWTRLLISSWEDSGLYKTSIPSLLNNSIPFSDIGSVINIFIFDITPH